MPGMEARAPERTRDEQRVGGVAELLAGVGLERGERGGHLLVDAVG